MEVSSIRSGQPLGDPHNFGRRVLLDLKTQRLHKPRTLYWEWLFLGSDSPLRSLVNDEARLAGIHSPFRLMPSLQFELNEPVGDSVSRWETAPTVSGVFDDSTLESIGGCLALLLWFGIGDLHAENICLGIDSNGDLSFGPLDIECLFDQYHLLSQTRLLPAADFDLTDCGLLRLWTFMREYPRENALGALIHGFLSGLDFLERLKPRIEQLILGLPGISERRVRMIPRKTRDYYLALSQEGPSRGFSPPFCGSELEQLERKDIPYYFRKLGSRELYYYQSPERVSEADLPKEISSRLLSLSRFASEGSLSPGVAVARMGKLSSLQIARFFDGGAHRASIRYKDISLLFNGDELFLQREGKLAVQCKRSGTHESQDS